jgi:membrane protein DedA with SNARE-associated domain
MDAAEWFIVFLVPHLYLTVFLVSVIDATGLPFPGRIILVLAGAFAHGAAHRSWRSTADSPWARTCVSKTR